LLITSGIYVIERKPPPGKNGAIALVALLPGDIPPPQEKFSNKYFTPTYSLLMQLNRKNSQKSSLKT
ncbi:MAG: hypothetical protein FWH57_13725, partial [Oscillospiraceae bacterium]|nr:hypothetical protein [Oscillospiraceae bacterium]